MGKIDIAWLIYKGANSGSSRHKNASFEGIGNQGARVVGLDIFNTTGSVVKYCTAESAHKFRIVLVSFTSNYDVIAFARAVYKLHTWRKKKRKFIVIGGGFGMQNPTHIVNWLDYAYFGRSENEIGKIIKSNFLFETKSLMRISDDGIHSVVVRQSSELLEFDTRVGRKEYKYKEEMHGCPNKCAYCHFTFARKHKGRRNFVVNLTGGKSLELEWMDCNLYDPNKSDIITALDGMSEKSRYLYNRRLSNEKVFEFIEHILYNMKVGCTDLNLYNILGLECSSKSDWSVFMGIVEKLNEKYKGNKKLRIKITNTPFRPSPMTPAAWAPVQLNYKDELCIKAYKVLYDINYSVKYNSNKRIMLFRRSPLESEASLLADLSVIRAGVKNSSNVFNLFTFNSKFRALRRPEQYSYLLSKYDLSELTGEIQVSSKTPTWFLNGYISNNALVKMRKKISDNSKKQWDTKSKRFK